MAIGPEDLHHKREEPYAENPRGIRGWLMHPAASALSRLSKRAALDERPGRNFQIYEYPHTRIPHERIEWPTFPRPESSNSVFALASQVASLCRDDQVGFDISESPFAKLATQNPEHERSIMLIADVTYMGPLDQAVPSVPREPVTSVFEHIIDEGARDFLENATFYRWARQPKSNRRDPQELAKDLALEVNSVNVAFKIMPEDVRLEHILYGFLVWQRDMAPKSK